MKRRTFFLAIAMLFPVASVHSALCYNGVIFSLEYKSSNDALMVEVEASKSDPGFVDLETTQVKLYPWLFRAYISGTPVQIYTDPHSCHDGGKISMIVFGGNSTAGAQTRMDGNNLTENEFNQWRKWRKWRRYDDHNSLSNDIPN